jgi:hypothetical protein
MNKNFQKIDNGIYLYKNFLSLSEIDKINSYLDSLSYENWNVVRQDELYSTIGLDFLNFLQDKYNNLLFDNLFFISNHLNVNKMIKNASWGQHADTHDYQNLNVVVNNEQEFKEVDMIKYCSVLYYNNFEGGEIYYPEKNITIAPVPGDLILHDAKIVHGVNIVKSDKRYSTTKCFYEKIKVAV